MCEREEGATVDTGAAVAPMRQPGAEAGPAPQWVSVGQVLDNLLLRLEREMNESAITKS